MNKIEYYLWILFLLIVTLGTCICIAIKKNNKYTKAVVKLLVLGVLSISFYAGFLKSHDYRHAMFYFVLYNAVVSFNLYFIFSYVIVYTDLEKKLRVLRAIIFIISILDVATIFTNIKTEAYFSLIKSSYDFIQWQVNFNYAYVNSVLTSLVIMMICSVILGYKAKKSASIYKGKYYSMLLLSLITFTFALISIFYRTRFDYSVFLYGIVSISISYYTFYSSPKMVVWRSSELIIEEISSAVLCFDVSDKCIYANEKARNIFELEYNKDYEKVNPYIEKVKNKYKGKIPEFDSWEGEIDINGKNMDLYQEINKIIDNKNKEVGYFIVMQDWNKEIKTLKEEQFRMKHDSLTGILNRNSFFEDAEKLIKEHFDEGMYMFAFNTKDFKLINELFGIKKGDEVLKEQAKILSELSHKKSLSGRINGDRFAVVTTKKEFSEKIFYNAVDRIQNMFESANYKIHMYMGIYEIADIKEPVENMYDKANLAIKYIKDSYVQKIAMYDTNLMDKLLYERNIVNEFDKAVENEEFCIFLQPQIKKDEQIIGAEALVRWKHPARGLLFPGAFIDIYENTGLIYKLDILVWNLAARKLKEWNDKGINDLYISVNVSPKDFYFIDVPEELLKIVEEYGINPKNLRVEITESAMMSEGSKHIELIDKLRRAGFIVEIDDFGCGYSSLNVLKDILADVIKIDMKFLEKTENRDRSKIIIEAVIEMSKKLGMQVVTEGVEEKEQVDSLYEMGCNVFQGYFFDKPLEISEFEKKYLCS